MARIAGAKSRHLTRLAVAAAASALFVLPQAASADIIYDSSILITGQGFGNNPRLLTEQETGNGDDVESACVSAGAGGSIGFGSGACISDSRVFQGNGFTNTAGDEVNPMADNQKYGIPTIGEMGFQDASDIGLLFNATEPSGDGVNIEDVTLKFYGDDGSLLAAIDGSHQFNDTNPGNGVAGFTFVVDQAQQDYLNSTIFSLPDFSDVRIALESTISDAQGGPESWLAVNLNRSSTGGSTSTGGTPVPAPAGLGLFALAAAGLIAGRGKRKRAA